RPSVTPPSRASCRGSWWRTRRTSSDCATSTKTWRRRTDVSSVWARAWVPSARCTSAATSPRRGGCCATPTTPGSRNTSAGLGFWEGSRRAEDGAKYPLDPYTPLPPAEWTVERMRQVKYALAGRPDDIKREVEALRTIGGNGDLEWFGWFFDQGFMSWDEEVRQIEMFAKHIIPAFR